ncbi:MAG TPA: hypothetical protein VMC09_14730 [Anaerolineales bacterium]|nr:hypothetical protein [Anaerolineales bacterium]
MKRTHRPSVLIVIAFLPLLLGSCSQLAAVPTPTPLPTSTFTPTPAPSLTPTPTSTATPIVPQTACGRYENVVVGDNVYMVQNNLYNDAAKQAQCIVVQPDTGAFTVERADNQVRLDGSPASYPFIWKGCHWGLCTSGSGLPLQVGKIQSARSSWSITTVPTGVWDIAYDVWINKTPTTPKGANGAEIMIWLNSHDMTPYGNNDGTVTLSGSKWNVTHTKFDVAFIVYRSAKDLTSVDDLDIKSFLDDAASRGWIQNDWYLITVDAGFELWHGGAGLASNSFSFTAVGTP